MKRVIPEEMRLELHSEIYDAAGKLHGVDHDLRGLTEAVRLATRIAAYAPVLLTAYVERLAQAQADGSEGS